MTKLPRGSSLPQARSYHHNHYHLHNKRAAAPENARHHHRQLDDAEPSPSPSPEAQSSTTAPRVVVQTVSVIQIVDASGAPIEVQTHYPTPATVDAETTSSAAFDLSIAAVPSASSTDGSSSSESANTAILSIAAVPTPSSTDSSASQVIPLTSDLSSSLPLSSATPSYSTLSATSNSTISFLTSSNSSSTSVFTTTTSLSTSVTSSILTSLSSTSDWASASDSSELSSSAFTTASSSALSAEPTASADGTAGGVGGGAAGQPAPTSTPTSTSDGSSSNGSPTPTGTVVGSVVGSIAGVAFLVVLVFFALRWKKQSGGRFRLSDPNATGKRGILNGSGGPDGSNSGGMIQRSLSYGPTAAAGATAAAAVKPPSRRASEPSETGERGFVRVAGRKLPSVLQAGGDGYTDPREGTANDDESVYYRDSQAFFEPNGQTRLALGSPMRPVSGVVVLKESPARTPVTESAPFPDTRSTFFPLQPPARDPVGRSLTSQDGSRGSRGSASRFTEDM